MPYSIAMIDMEIARLEVESGNDECIFILEHNSLYSAGKSYEECDFLIQNNYKVYYSNRGGRVTVHNPGQIVVYPVLNLKKRAINIHQYVKMLEQWMIDVLRMFNIKGTRKDGAVGIWANEAKIGFVGIRIVKGITSHGICLNVCNDLTLFDAIIPCGIDNVKITSISKILQKHVYIKQVKAIFANTCKF